MAFCKFCGKEIPDGSVCSCQSNNAAQVNFPAGNPAPMAANNNGDAGIPLDKVKKNLPLIIAGVVAFLVLVLVLIFIGNHTGAKGAANKYAKALTKKSGGKAYLSLTLPDDVIKEMKDDDEWKDAVEDYNDGMSDLLDDVKIKVKSVKKGSKLNKKALKGAEAYWEDQGADDPKAKKGYEFKIKLQKKEDGDKDTNTTKICVVKFKGEGWKVIPLDADYLKSMGEDD